MKSVVIIAGGRSVLEESGGLDLLWSKLQATKAEKWSLNFSFLFMPFLPDRQLWVDETFFKNRLEDIEALDNAQVVLNTKEHAIYNNFTNIKQYKCSRNEKEKDFSNNKIFIGGMGLCGSFAIDVAVKENYKQIFVLGLDFGTNNLQDDKTHWYQERASEFDIRSSGLSRPRTYLDDGNKIKHFAKDFDFFKRYTDVAIYNVSQRSNLSAFEKINYTTFYQKILDI
jgi:hypothetical protein